VSRFFDSNIPIYAQEAGPKGDSARALMTQGGVISVQVVNEFANVMRCKYKRTWPEIEAAIADLLVVFDDVRPVNMQMHHMAMFLVREHNTSFYDALIIAAAIDAECEILFSEDLQDGRRFGDLLVVNPFANQLRGF
jgi:predicted nucleic acid-binding protein